MKFGRSFGKYKFLATVYLGQINHFIVQLRIQVRGHKEKSSQLSTVSEHGERSGQHVSLTHAICHFYKSDI